MTKGAKTINKRAKRRGGRPTKEGQRHPGGKLVQKSEAQREREALSVAIEARRRVFGISEAAAAGEAGGSALGRMLDPRDAHNKNQYEAGKTFEQARRDYQTAQDIKRLRSASDYSGAGGYDNADGTDPDYIEWCNRAISRYDAMRWAILECGDPIALLVVEAVVFEDKEMWSQIGSLRCGLNAVSRIDRLQPNHIISVTEDRDCA